MVLPRAHEMRTLGVPRAQRAQMVLFARPGRCAANTVRALRMFDSINIMRPRLESECRRATVLVLSGHPARGGVSAVCPHVLWHATMVCARA